MEELISKLAKCESVDFQYTQISMSKILTIWVTDYEFENFNLNKISEISRLEDYIESINL